MSDDAGEEASSPSSIQPTTADASDSNTVRNDDLAFDGMWPFSGFSGIMVRLAEDFVKSQQELADADTLDNNNEDEEVEFETVVVLKDIDPTDEAAIYQIQETLDEKGLKMADGVLRRLLEGCCPPKIKITRLSEDTMQTLLGRKKEGNQQFVEKGYREAIDCYDFALEAIPTHQRDKLHVIPKEQLTELVNILSNKAECLLRKAKYEAAAEASTDALIFDNCHEKSRLRRAKAGLEIGMYDRYEATSRGDGTMTGVAYLVQAKHDLEDILGNPESSSSSRSAAEKVMSKVDKLLAGAKKKVLSKDPDAEWDLTVLKIRSRCW